MRLLAQLAHFLTPQESNNYKAKVLHHSSLSSFIGLVLFVQLVLSGFLVVQPSVLGFAAQISPERIVELTNQERAKIGAPPLKLNSILSESAQRKAGDMFAFNYWAHNSPSGRDPWSFFKEVGYRYLYAGENLARDFSSPEAVVSAWMASPSHRENLLNPKYHEIGVSVVDGTLNGNQTTLVVQHFGTTSSSKAEVPAQAVAIKTTTEEKPVVKTAKPTPTSINESPTPTPFVIVANSSSESPKVVLSQASGAVKPLANPFRVTQYLVLFVILFLLIVTVVDGLAVYHKRVVRLSGKSLAHFLFLGSAFLLVALSSQGAVL